MPKLIIIQWSRVPEELRKFPTSDAEVAAFRRWCDENDVHYYARPKESYSIFEATDEAHTAGRSKLLLEDLS